MSTHIHVHGLNGDGWTGDAASCRCEAGESDMAGIAEPHCSWHDSLSALSSTLSASARASISAAAKAAGKIGALG